MVELPFWQPNLDVWNINSFFNPEPPFKIDRSGPTRKSNENAGMLENSMWVGRRAEAQLDDISNGAVVALYSYARRIKMENIEKLIELLQKVRDQGVNAVSYGDVDPVLAEARKELAALKTAGISITRKEIYSVERPTRRRKKSK